MSRQTSVPIRHLSLHASNRSARETARSADRGQIDLTPPYQRGSVWTEDQRMALVRSWLSGVPVPAVILNDRTNDAWVNQYGDPGEMFWAVVDGKQRIETARAWFTGDLAVPASWFNPEHVAAPIDTADGPYVRFDGLTLPGQRIMGNRASLPVIEAKVASLQEEADLYLLINGGGTPQTDADLANAALHSSEM